MNQNSLPPSATLMQFIVGKWISKPIYAAAQLGLADMLASGPKHVAELAEESRTHAPSLYRVMRALASVGIFSENDDGRFELTPMAELLQTDKMRPIALLFNAQWSDAAWGCFLETVKTGKTAFEIAFDMPLFDYLSQHPEVSRVFEDANAIKAVSSHRAILDVYDFSDIEMLLDIGGGTGALMAEILTANTNLKGKVAERSAVIPEIKKNIRAKGLDGRLEAVVCDFFEHVPAGGDVYMMSHILHDWTDEQCRRILHNCRQAMQKEARLLIVEIVVPPGNAPSIAKLLDLEMLVMAGGRERTEEEFQQLLEFSGFSVSRVIPTAESISVIEAVRL